MRNRVLFVMLATGLVLQTLNVEAQAATHSRAVQRETHAPIHIQTDLSLLGPDALARNGVRGGTGTPIDPWRISGWQIEAGEAEDAIVINQVRGHLLIEDVEVRVPRGFLAFSAIRVIGSPNVVLRDIESSGNRTFGTFAYSGVKLTNVTIRNSGAAGCIDVEYSRLEVSNLVVEDTCGLAQIYLRESDFVGRRILMPSSSNGFSVYNHSGVFEIQDVRMVGTPKREISERVELRGSPAAATGVRIQARDAARITLHNVSIENFHYTCVEITGEKAPRAVVGMESVTLDECSRRGNGYDVHGIKLDELKSSEVYLTDLRLTGRQGNGISAINSRATVDNSLISGFATGIAAWGDHASLHIRDSTLSGNKIDASAFAPARIEITNGWWPEECEGRFEKGPCHRFEGNVRVITRSGEPPVPLPEPHESPTRATPSAGFVATLASGLLGALARTARRAP